MRADTAWMLPGGGVEHGEHPEDTVVRELAEETGLDVAVDEFFDVVSDRRESRGNDFHNIVLTILVVVWLVSLIVLFVRLAQTRVVSPVERDS